MKHSNVWSAITGGIFFAVPYLALSTSFVPSLMIGVSAFCAGELVFRQNNKESSLDKNEFGDMIKHAKVQNKHVSDMIPEINDESVRLLLNEIHNSVQKIIKTVEKKPQKASGIHNFFDYYLPVVVKIIDRYDEIENQDLSSSESKKFFGSTKKMLEEANKAFKKILNDLYQRDMIDTNVEMKVFNSMLKSDGFGKNEFDILKENENE